MAYIGVSPGNGVRKKHTYTADASQTSFTGAGAEGVTLSYKDSNFVDVYQNGVKLAEADYTSTSGTTVVLAQAAAADDIVEIIVYDVFSVADTVSKADGGTFDGNVAFAGNLSIGSTAITSTAAELNILDGVTSTAAELNILDGVTSTTAELNILDGVTSTAAELNILDGVTSTFTELNLLDGVTATTAELNILDGVTSTAAELNILDGVTSTATELNLLDGVTATTAELNILDGVTSTAAELNALDGITAVVGELNALDIGSTAVGTAVASKAVILDSSKDYTGIRNLTISGELDAATLDISGAIDVAGTANLDIVDIDGAVDMATTLQVDGVATFTGRDIHNGGITIANAGQIGSVGDADAIAIASDGVVTMTQIPVLSAGLNVSGGTIAGTLATAAQGNITSLGNLSALTVDDITIDGSTITDAGTMTMTVGALTIDATNDIILDAGGGDIILKDDGTEFGNIANSSSDLQIVSIVSDKDIIFRGNDGGSFLNALTLDMSDAGTAIFNHDISLADNGKANFGSSADFQIYHDSSNAYLRNELSDSDIIFQGNDGGTQVEIARFDVSGKGFAVGTTSAGLGFMAVHGPSGGNATFKAANTSTSGNTTCIMAFMDGSGSATSNSAFLQGFNGANSFYLLGNGTHSFTSDENAKKNIETTRDGYLEDLAKLRVVKYNWKEQEDGDDKELGLIAQEVETVFPKLVMLDIDPQIEDADKKKMIKTTVLPFMLLKGLQEANTKIEALKTENATQSTQIADLISRIVTLENA